MEKTEEVISPFFVEQKKANSQRFKETEKALHMQPQIDQETILYTEADMQEKSQKVHNIMHCKDMNDHKVKEPSKYPDCNQQKHQLGHVSPNFDCASLKLLPPTQVSPTLRNYTADTTSNTIDTKTPRTLPDLTTAMKSDDDAQSPGVSKRKRSRSSTITEKESLSDNHSVWSPSKSRSLNSDSDSSSEWSPPKTFLKRAALISKMTKAPKVKLHCRFCGKNAKLTTNGQHNIVLPKKGAPANCPHCPMNFIKQLS